MPKKIWDFVQERTRDISGLFLFLMIMIIFIQVVTRYVFFYSIPWSEELSRYLFIGLVFFSLNATIKDDIPIRIDFLDQVLKGKAKKALSIFNQVCTLMILLIFSYSGFKFFLKGFNSVSPAISVPLYVIYAVIPLGFMLASIATCIKIKELVQEGREE